MYTIQLTQLHRPLSDEIEMQLTALYRRMAYIRAVPNPRHYMFHLFVISSFAIGPLQRPRVLLDHGQQRRYEALH